jgi:ribosomal protein S18 acetylase RimI-like enzyme
VRASLLPGRRRAGTRAAVRVLFAREDHARHAPRATALLRWAAQEGAAVAARTPSYLERLMRERKAVLALARGRLVGFVFLQAWDGGAFVSHSGLVVDPAFRGAGVARALKEKILVLTRRRFPRAAIVSLTRAPEVLRMNRRLGFRRVSQADLPRDPAFWKACRTCPYYESPARPKGERCCCRATRYDPPGCLLPTPRILPW